MFTATWYNPSKNIYDYFYTPTNYLTINKVRLNSKYDTSNYIDTEISLSQLHSYINGYDLVNNIFNEEVSNWLNINNRTTNYIKYKNLVDKVQVC